MTGNAREATAPWIVFAASCVVRAAPRVDAPSLATLSKGATLLGDYHVEPETDEEWLRTTVEGREGYAPRWDLHRVHPVNRVEGNLPLGGEVVNRWWGLPVEYEPDDLVPVPDKYRYNPEREYPLRAEALKALMALLRAAEEEGVPIIVCSAYRSGEYQLTLYTNAVEKSGANQRYSAPPGHSEHQLGTCVDLCDRNGEQVLTQEFEQTVQGQWLERNAARFGFRRSYYPHNVKETGYIPEPWHWRYWGTEPPAGGN